MQVYIKGKNIFYDKQAPCMIVHLINCLYHETRYINCSTNIKGVNINCSTKF